MDGSMVKIHDVFHNGQPQPRTALFAAAALIHPVEPLEYAVQAFLWNSHAVVLYPYQHVISLFPHRNPHLASGPVVLDGIGGQVGKQLLHLLQVSTDTQGLAVHMEKHLAGGSQRL